MEYFYAMYFLFKLVLFFGIVIFIVNYFSPDAKLKREKRRFVEINQIIKSEAVDKRKEIIRRSFQQNTAELADISINRLNKFKMDVTPRQFQAILETIIACKRSANFERLYGIYSFLVDSNASVIIKRIENGNY